MNAVPEFEDCAKLAAANNLPVKEVQALARLRPFRRRQGRAIVSRFFLTTAIDYVNSRPHLGTAYEKICADVIARYKRLCGVETRFPDGERRALAERVQEGDRSRASIRWPTAIRWSEEFRRTWRHLDISFDDFIRTTEPRHKAGVTALAKRCSRGRRHLRGRLRGLVLRQLRGVQAGEGSRQRQLPAAPDAQARMDPGEELLLPAVEVPAAAARSLRRASRVPAAGHPPQRDPAAARERPRGHFGQPRRPVVGHPAAVRSVERRLRVVRRADQLRVGGRPRLRSADVREVVAGGPARHRQGHHALSRRDLAGDADGARSCRCRARSSATGS